MNELTREEAACFRTALALVVVKKRLEQKQQNQQPMPPPNNGKRSDLEEPDSQKTPAKRVKFQTMDSLIFPHWAAAATAEDDDDDASNDNDTNQNPLPNAATIMTPARLQQVQSKQAEHLQSMMDTAIRTALCLVPEQQEHQKKSQQQQHRSKNMRNNDAPSTTPMTQPATLTNTDHSQQQQQQAAWSTLEALSLHLAQQVSFALKVAKMPTAAAAKENHQQQYSATVDAKKKTTPKAPPPSDQWVADWVRESLRKLLTQDTSPRTMDAAFLVWHGILLGGFSNSSSSNPKVTSSSLTPNYPACQSLFRQVFCDLLQEFGIVRGSRKSRRTARSTKAKDDTSTVTTVGTSGSGSNAQAGRSRSDDRAATSGRVASKKPAQRGGRSSGNACHERMDQWLVHGLQLLQKLAQEGKKNADTGGGSDLASTSRLLHCLHPNSFLPPTDLVKWYVDTEAAPSSMRAKKNKNKKKARQPAHVQKGLGPGATLMTMVSLYQALEDK